MASPPPSHGRPTRSWLRSPRNTVDRRSLGRPRTAAGPDGRSHGRGARRRRTVRESHPQPMFAAHGRGARRAGVDLGVDRRARPRRTPGWRRASRSRRAPFARPSVVDDVFQVPHPVLASEFPPLRSLPSRSSELPAPVDRFVGRADELRDIEADSGELGCSHCSDQAAPARPGWPSSAASGWPGTSTTGCTSST